jgi:hypothetical protein
LAVPAESRNVPSTHPKADHLAEWRHERYLGHPNFGLRVPQIEAAIAYEEAARIDTHQFFELASSSKETLQVWAEQELITSSCFSQVITEWFATINNCHIRSKVMDVLVGEHSPIENGLATRCHPYLAEMLCRSLGSDLVAIKTLEPTRNFIREMEDSAARPLAGAGFLGIGNEKMLIPEYSAIRRVFHRVWPEAECDPFLDANIEDDMTHHRLIEEAAAAMVSMGGDPEEFLEHAKRGVDARIIYYDELIQHLAIQSRGSAIGSGAA